MSEFIIDWDLADSEASVAVIDPAARQVQFWRTRPVLTAQTPGWQRPTWRDPQEKVGNFCNAYAIPDGVEIPADWVDMCWYRDKYECRACACEGKVERMFGIEIHHTIDADTVACREFSEAFGPVALARAVVEEITRHAAQLPPIVDCAEMIVAGLVDEESRAELWNRLFDEASAGKFRIARWEGISGDRISLRLRRKEMA